MGKLLLAAMLALALASCDEGEKKVNNTPSVTPPNQQKKLDGLKLDTPSPQTTTPMTLPSPATPSKPQQ